jgi:putative phosphoesterase
MLIGILSDTHDRLVRTKAAVATLEAAGAQALLHCGDFVESEMLVPCAGLPCHFVFGNNDSPTQLERAAKNLDITCLGWSGLIELDGKKIGLTHGHSLAEFRRLQAASPHYILTGHSHIPHDYREGPTRYINPGALHRARPYTVALLDLATDELRFVEVPT